MIIYIERFKTMASRRESKTCLWVEKEMLMELIHKRLEHSRITVCGRVPFICFVVGIIIK